jgi:succinyl-CoA synthetase alpha subunit
VICITEGIPVRDMIRTRAKMKGKKTLLLGPQLPRHDHARRDQDRHHAGPHPPQGRIGIVSRSGTLTYEAVGQVTALGLGQSSAVGIGGDPVNGLKHIDVLKMFNDDPEPRP